MSLVAGTTRYLCPLECGWHHDVPPPSVDRVVRLGSTAELDDLPAGEAVSAMATQAYLAEAGLTETALREHLATHATVEFATVIHDLRVEIAGLKRDQEASA